MAGQHIQIGEVAERTGLSLRTIRYYEEVGLVVPSARSAGGFRLYAEADVARLMLVRRMKPLGFTLEEMRRLLETLDAVRDSDRDEAERRSAVTELQDFQSRAGARVEEARRQLDVAQEFAEQLRTELERQG